MPNIKPINMIKATCFFLSKPLFTDGANITDEWFRPVTIDSNITKSSIMVMHYSLIQEIN